jgi:probable HAF family extracellular repeat protein
MKTSQSFNVYSLIGFITGPDGANMRDLAEGGGTGINNAGQVAGWGATSEGAQHAYITGDNGEASFIRWLDNSNPLSIFKTGVTAL